MTNLKYVGVRFINPSGSLSEKLYWYSTALSLLVSGKYYIATSSGKTYENPVVVVEVSKIEPVHYGITHSIGVITDARAIECPKVPHSKIKVVTFNEPKCVTAVRWTDGTVTKVKCQPGDVFDKEKALALCYMKRWCFDNRGCFNNVFRQYCEEDENGN